ncbi:hypothetical protein [Zoogloea sp.]|uniref:hypothetical protein n=1 Tax=Zoogloea sp. TaxID=49181 RepID=UPI0035B2BED1
MNDVLDDVRGLRSHSFNDFWFAVRAKAAPHIKPHIGAGAAQRVDIGFDGDVAYFRNGRGLVGVEFLAQATRHHAVEQSAAAVADADDPDLRFHGRSFKVCGTAAERHETPPLSYGSER